MGQVFAAAAPLRCSWIVNDTWLSHERLELENDLVAGHLLVTGEIPDTQFQGCPRKEASCSTGDASTDDVIFMSALVASSRGGISTPREHPLIFLFTGESGEQYGYHDGWELDGTFRYFGEGQVGDMRFVSGNKAIRDHAETGKDPHLLAPPAAKGVRYVGQMVCAGYELVAGVPDVLGQPCEAVAFHLAPIDAALTSPDEARFAPEETRELNAFWSVPLEQLRARAEERPSEGAPVIQALRTTYRRSAAVRIYVLRRADGRCEGCREAAPFITSDGHPYLEPHHTRRLSDEGPDTPAHVIALCPTCHRRAHYAADAAPFNASLVEALTGIVGPSIPSRPGKK
jgi:5-methylcytosine-specific restriction protein A